MSFRPVPSPGCPTGEASNADPRIDPTIGMMDPKEWPVLLDYLGYPQACILYVQTLVLQNVRPKHVHLFTVCKSREP